jgi:hypothetical protein
MLYFCRLNNYTKFSSFVDPHLMNTGKEANFLMQLYSNHSNLMMVVFGRLLKIYQKPP